MDVLDRYNLVVGAIVAVLTTLFGAYWYVFAGFLLCNVLDWLTGWYKSYKLGKESSKAGFKGILKKTGYWVIFLVAFLMPALFVHLGQDIFNINLNFLFLLGWFTLATLLINEIRSILENLVECGYNVPAFLISGLEITQKLIDAEVDIPGTDKDDKS